MTAITDTPRKKTGRPTKGDKPMTPAERARSSRQRMAEAKQQIGDGIEAVQLLISTEHIKRVRAFADELDTHPATILTRLTWPLLTEFMFYADRTPEGRLSDVDNKARAAEVASNLREYAGLPAGVAPPKSDAWPRPHYEYLKHLIAENISNTMIADMFNAERFDPPTGAQWTPALVSSLLVVYGLSRKTAKGEA